MTKRGNIGRSPGMIDAGNSEYLITEMLFDDIPELYYPYAYKIF